MLKLNCFLIVASFFCIEIASAQTSQEILRNEDGSFKYMSQLEALRACPAGTHLPTVRELSMISQARGAKGILELDQVSANAVPAGYNKISAINSNGQRDEFYFIFEGFQGNEDTVRPFLWSSSRSQRYTDTAYYLSSGYGYIVDDLREDLTYRVAVMCVSNQ